MVRRSDARLRLWRNSGPELARQRSARRRRGAARYPSCRPPWRRLCWLFAAQELLRALALGPNVSRIASGDDLADAITDLCLALYPGAVTGLALCFDCFDDLLSWAQAGFGSLRLSPTSAAPPPPMTTTQG
ncbi:unnamed protein product [Urochloa humidicola]